MIRLIDACTSAKSTRPSPVKSAGARIVIVFELPADAMRFPTAFTEKVDPTLTCTGPGACAAGIASVMVPSDPAGITAVVPDQIRQSFPSAVQLKVFPATVMALVAFQGLVRLHCHPTAVVASWLSVSVRLVPGRAVAGPPTVSVTAWADRAPAKIRVMKIFSMTHCLLLGGGLLIAQAAKESPAVLKADRCHYIIQGATVERASRLYASGRGGCVKGWHSFTTYTMHLYALRVYRSEVEEAWPVGRRDWELMRDLAKIDAEDKTQ